MTNEEAWEVYSYCQSNQEAFAAIGISDKYREACEVLENAEIEEYDRVALHDSRDCPHFDMG
jgi:hypothetical protein|tara:strand:+ start:171 stop:356 length:186 start_codon:yes stop_codon:yes gene_type:complete